MMTSQHRFPIVIFIIALALRLAFTLCLQSHYFYINHPSDDVLYYQNWAKSIAQGNWLGEHVFSGMPLFPYFLAILIRLFLGAWGLVHVFNLLLGTLNCVLVYFLAKRFMPPSWAWIAGLLAASDFTLIYYDWLLMPVTLIITLSLILCLALTDSRALETHEWLLAGILTGLAALADGKFLIFTIFLSLVIFWQSKRQKQQLIHPLKNIIIPFLLGTLIITGGILLRNRIVGGEWILTSSQTGLSFYIGNNADASGAYNNPGYIRPNHTGQDSDQKIFVEQALQKKVTHQEVNDFYKSKAMQFIVHHPSQYLQLLGKKITLFFSHCQESDDIDMLLLRDLQSQLNFNTPWILWPLSLLGIWYLLRKNPKSLPLALIVLSQLSFCLIFFVTTRLTASIWPLLILFQVYALYWTIDQFKSKNYRPVLISIITMTGFFFLFPSNKIPAADLEFIELSKAGPIYLEQKEYSKAINIFQQALTLRPNDSNILYNLGTVYLNMKELDKAKALFLQSMAVCHFNVDASFNLGYIYEQTNQPLQAIASYQDVLHYEPESLDARYRLGLIYQTLGQCQEAGKYFQEIIGRKPELKPELQKAILDCQSSHH